MSLSDILSRIFGGAADGLSSYMQVKNYQDEQGYRRKRDTLEDQRAQDANQRAWEQQAYQKQQDQLNRQIREAEQAGIMGSSSALDALHKAAGNQTQGGAGTGEATFLPSALKALQEAQARADYNPRKQVDLGNGAYWHGPEFGKVRQRYVQDRAGNWMSLENDESAPTGVQGAPPRAARGPNVAAETKRREAEIDRYVAAHDGDSSKALTAYLADSGEAMPTDAAGAQRLSQMANDFVAASKRLEAKTTTTSKGPGGTTVTTRGADPTAAGPAKTASDRWNELRHEGMSEAQATAKVRQEFGL